MVMHARKLPRINDGFSDKHQSHNAYESSKYGSSGSGGGKYRGGSQMAYAGPDKRDSPSANSLRSSSPDSRSQSPRYHKSSSSNYYKREREYTSREHRENRDGSRSPKERRRDRHTDHSCRNSTMKKDSGSTLRVGDWSEHVSSNGKRYYYNCKSEKSQWEKPQDWLDWEHHRHSSTSSSHNKLAHYNNTNKGNYSSSSSNLSNKIAYNNLSHTTSSASSISSSTCLQYGSKGASANAYNTPYTNSSSNNKNNSSSNNSNSFSSTSSNINSKSSSSSYGGIPPSSSISNNSSSNMSTTNLLHPSSSSVTASHHLSSHHHHHHHHHQQHHHSHHATSATSNSVGSASSKELAAQRGSGSLQDKNKLDKHSNIDSRDHHYDKRKYGSGQDMEISSGGSTPTSESVLNRVTGGDMQRKNHNSNSSTSCTMNAVSSSTTVINNSLYNSATTSSLSQTPSSNRLLSSSNSSASTTTTNVLADPRHHHHHHSNHHNNNIADGNKHNSHLEPLSVNVHNSGGGQGPPTPTHSETHDGVDMRKGTGDGSSGSALRLVSSSSGGGSMVSSLPPCSSSSNNNNSNNNTGLISSLSSLTQQQTSQSWGASSLGSSLSSQRSQHPPPALTPSLSKYYNETLIGHVKDWPAENLERQSQRMAEEVHTAGSLIMTKVSADLKMARSLVRLAEIQATLHEQRILFLRAQRRELDEMGVRSQSSFMGEPTSSNS